MIGILTNQKGGVAKTTNTIHLASSLAQKGHKVLLIDFDPQCDLSHGVGVRKNSYDVVDFLDNKDKENFRLKLRAENFVILPGNKDFISLKYKKNSLKKALNRKIKALNNNSLNEVFDFIFIDCPPGKIVLEKDLPNHQPTEVEMALFASDFFLVPLAAEEFAVKNCNQFIGKVSAFVKENNLSLNFLGFFFGMILSTSKDKEYYDSIFYSSSSNHLFKSYIRQDTEVKKAIRLGKTIFQYKPNCRAAKDYISLTNEFLNSLNN